MTPRVRILSGWGDPSARPATWPPGGSVFQTYDWAKAWWEIIGRGTLVMTVVERDGHPVVLAPFYADGGMVFFVGSGGSDYLDFVGDLSDPDVLDTILATARDRTPGFVGFRFYHVPDDSPTGRRLNDAAGRLGVSCFDEGDLPAPLLSPLDPAAAEKASLVRHEKWFRREGSLSVIHLRDGPDILPHLDPFFDQHVERWAATPYPSLFLDPRQRAFYRRLCESECPDLRFTRIDWNGRPVAFHFGFCHNGTFLWYKPSFAIDLARRSPGEVLLRQLLLAAAAEGATAFDFGLGDEAFKYRFATRTRRVRTWGLYP